MSTPPEPLRGVAETTADFGLRELMAVREIVHAFLTASRPEEVYQLALDRVSPLVGASFACVWSDKPTREGIFRSMQARRTFGATAKIVLKVTAGDHWMGEIFSAKKMPPIQIEAQGSADIETIDVLIDGKVAKTFPCNGSQAKLSYESPSSLTGNHIFFIRLQQTDGNHAWSSPLWIDIQP